MYEYTEWFSYFFSNILFYEIQRRDISPFLIQIKESADISYILKFEKIKWLFYNNLLGTNENVLTFHKHNKYLYRGNIINTKINISNFFISSF